MTSDKKSMWGFVNPNNCSNCGHAYEAIAASIVCLYWAEPTTPTFECVKWEAK